MFEEGVDGFGVAKYKSKDSFGVVMFESFVEFFSNVITRETIVREAYVVEGCFFCIYVGRRREGFI